MKLVVFSDSHGDLGTLIEVVEEHLDAKTFLFLGDGDQEFQQLKTLYPNHEMKGVTGNCDWASKRLETTHLFEGKEILMTHGHTYGVKSGLENLFLRGRQRGVDAVFYGHTHQAEVVWRDDILYFCPGSISKYPHERPSYGVVTLTEDKLSPQVVWL